MEIINRLERKFGRYIPSDITKYIIFGQLAVFFFLAAYPNYTSMFYLEGDKMLAGQWWRLLTYLLKPITTDVLFGAFVYYIFYIYGTTLERRFGTFKYFLYLLLSFIANIILAFIFPQSRLTNTYMYTSLFLAFAWLYPDFTLMLFFVIPVKIKWLALIAWVGIALAFLGSDISGKVQILLSLSNFALFFWNDVLYIVNGKLRNNRQTNSARRPNRDPYHVCYICKTNELDNPKMQIRYCDICKPTTCYCGEHIDGHKHRVKN